MSGHKKRGEGIQVVSVDDEGRYVVASEALRGVAARAELRGLPVAVVSVAGATRGGKSFLLDFMLRYLRATPAAQRDGTWIGGDVEPLDGFSWRGGWQRNTTGILLWSEPFVVTQQIDGTTKKVVVLLMDTQGTFDNASTVRDCTTIFALSTLISSVQIYNLAQQIKEDDLQHLQLFTEYGRLALSETEAKPFQSLVFRIRDWMCPYEQPYGASGGDKYLDTVLNINKNQKEELQELRRNIRDSFESISCFLMPHPGFAVTDENFSGRLCDLRPEFVDSLLGFVPSILDSSKLIPKVINGHEIAIGDLVTYFNSYIETFNSEELPTPVSILNATSSACLEAALSYARELYVARMERASDERCVPRDVIPRLHAAATNAARQAFITRRTLAAPERAAQRLDRLLQELEEMLPTYIGLNEAKTQKLVLESRAAYDGWLRRIKGERSLCLHPCDVPDVHARALAAAAARFDAGREAGEGERDDDRTALIQSLEAKLSEATTASDLSNAAAQSLACAQYSASMQRAVRGGAVSAARLRSEHKRAAHAAREDFASKRNRTSQHPDSDDHFLNELLRYIQEQFDYLESVNKANNKSAKQAAVFSYNNHMHGVWGPNTCLHPNTLRSEHQQALKNALEEFCAAAEDPDQESDIKEILKKRYEELLSINRAGNEALVNESYAVYAHKMESKCTPSLASILVVPWLIKVLVMIPKFHQENRKAALDHFRSKRRGSGEDDEYIDCLKSKLDEGYESYRHPLHALAREFGIPT